MLALNVKGRKKMELLQRIVKLSHEFGSEVYVKGGGGNTSVKNDQTLWIKPSGTTLKTLTEESFVPMKRATLSGVREQNLSTEVAERESQVKDILMSAVEPGATGRPSVETMLHNAFSAQFVVHTHPALVNGLTCAVNGEKKSAELFPESIWIEYTDPGYVLFLKVDDEIKKYKKVNGKEPQVIFLENHGVFVAGDTEEEIREIYSSILKKLGEEYSKAGIDFDIKVNAKSKNAPANAQKLANLLATTVSTSGNFEVVNGPLTPDHIVYAKSFPFIGEFDREKLDSFKATRGYYPIICVCGGDVFACGASENRAELAMELAMDGAQVAQLCKAFGGVRFMSDAAREFIENWEAESYRSAMMK